MTISTPLTTPGATGTSRPRPPITRRWRLLAGSALVVVAAATTTAVVLDGSSADPIPTRLTRSVDAGDPAPSVQGPVSADAAERHATAASAAVVAGCSGLSADAAERCIAAG